MRQLVNREDSFASISPDTARQTPSMWPANERDSVLKPNSLLYTLSAQMNGYDPLQLRGYAELVAPDSDDPFWRGNIEAGRWRDRPYLLMKRAFWLHRTYAAGPLPPRGHVFPITTTAFVTDFEGLRVPGVPAAEVSARPYSPYVVRFPLLTEPLRLESTGSLDGPAKVLAVPAQPSGLHASLRIVVSCDARAILDIRLPEKAARGASQMVGSIELDEGLMRKEYDIPLPDADFLLIEFAPVFPRTLGTISLEEAEVVFDQADENWRIRVIERSANSVELEAADLADYRILSFIDFSYPGWRVFVDDEPVELLNTFSYFKGVEVPPGTHKVRFEFRPLAAYAGIAISIMSALLVAAGVVWTLVTGGARSGGEPVDDPAA